MLGVEGFGQCASRDVQISLLEGRPSPTPDAPGGPRNGSRKSRASEGRTMDAWRTGIPAVDQPPRGGRFHALAIFPHDTVWAMTAPARLLLHDKVVGAPLARGSRTGNPASGPRAAEWAQRRVVGRLWLRQSMDTHAHSAHMPDLSFPRVVGGTGLTRVASARRGIPAATTAL